MVFHEEQSGKGRKADETGRLVRPHLSPALVKTDGHRRPHHGITT